VQLHHGVILQELQEESSDPMKYAALLDGEDRRTQKERKPLLVEDIAIWYAFQFERQRIKKENLMPFLIRGKAFDIITSEPAFDHPDWEPEYLWFPQFAQSIRLITVVGQRYRQPFTFTLPDIIVEEKNARLGTLIEKEKYFVYCIYNINIEEKPYLVMLNSLFLKKHYKELEWREIAIRNVAKGIKVNKIKTHKLPRYTASIDRMVKSFFHVEYEEDMW